MKTKIQTKLAYIFNLAVATMTVIVGLSGILTATSGQKAFAAPAAPGCYEIVNGAPTKLAKCLTTGAVYDNGSGVNISAPASDKCYIYSANLYDGDPTWGRPYVQVSCDTLSACPATQELRYSSDKLGAPSCISVSAPTTGEFAGGAQPPSSGDSIGKASDPSGCDKAGNDCCQARAGQDLTAENCGIIGLLNTVFNFVSGGIGLAVVINIIYAGIQYSTAQGDPSAVNKSKTRIRNALIAFLMYLSLSAFIQWLIPGGVF